MTSRADQTHLAECSQTGFADHLFSVSARHRLTGMKTTHSTPSHKEPSISSSQLPARHTQLLRLCEVLQRTGVSRSWVYRQVADGSFPKPVKLNRTSAWLESEIEDWIDARIAQRDLVVVRRPASQ